MERWNIARESTAGKLEIIPAVVFVAFILLGLAAAVASAATPAETGDTSRGPLPVRVPVAALPDGTTTGWDIDGDGRPDMIQFKKTGNGESSVETAYDFDGDGKPDFVRNAAEPGAIHSQRDRSTGPSPLR